MESEYDLKGFRILKIYSDLLEGKVLKKKEYAEYLAFTKEVYKEI